MALESGALPESVFSDIANAIRGQNGLSKLYAPGDMAAAILALEWNVRYKIRALPSSGISGMLCFYNCRSLVGSNGTARSSSNTGYQYMRIDRAGRAGCLTAS